ncbi:Arrestin domain-containing protein 3 [Bulinus truncatus]|nr:Arrestin domain-containing protein 3 [Bulinus truncatus]
MGRMNIFEICFKNITGVYYSGQVVEGFITVELNQPMKMRGIRMNFKGEANVSWTETRETGDGDNRTTVHDSYTATEKYFNEESLIFGIWPKQGSTTQELCPGRHTFPFAFQLPLNLPSSFEDSVGHVRYIISCRIDRPWKFDHKTKRPFTVISDLDLNQTPGAMQSLQATKEKNLCCLCCKSGPIQATLHIDRAGYVPGEAIKIFADISNGSSRHMDKSYVNLLMYKSFHATTSTRVEAQEVAKVTRPSIPPHSEDIWSGEALIIPPLPPSYLNGCKIIDIKYVLKLNVDPSGPSRDLEIPLDIIIGTIPLRSVVNCNPPMAPPPVSYNQLYQWNITPGAKLSDVVYPISPDNAPPPSYLECVTGRYDIRDREDDKYVKGQLDYAPVYPYYNWGHIPNGLPT